MCPFGQAVTIVFEAEIFESVTTEQSSRNVAALCYVTMFVVATMSLSIKFIFEKHLSLDGVYYFTQVLEREDFVDIAWSRRFAEYLTEWPLVIAVKLGITDIGSLIDIFAIGVYFPYMLSFLLSWYAVRDEDWNLLWFPLAGYLSINMLSDYSMIADHHSMALMSWPIVLLLLRDRQLRWHEGLVLCVLLIIYSRLYEAAVLTGLLMLGMCLIRLLKHRGKETTFIVIACILLITCVAISIQYILEPRSPQNRNNFLDSIWVYRRNIEAMVISAFFSLFCLGWLVGRGIYKFKVMLYILSILPVLWYIGFRLTTDYAVTAYISFSSRTLTVIVLPSLICFAMVVRYFKRCQTKSGVLVFSFVFVVFVCFNTLDTQRWTAYSSEMKKIISTNDGYLSIDETTLKDDPYKDYRWDWNNTLLGIVWSYPCVRSIIVNSDSEAVFPFNPKKGLILKRYVGYVEEFWEVDKSFQVCDG